MDRVPIEILRRLHRLMVYARLDQLAGRLVHVVRAESVHDDVIAALADVVPVVVTTKEPPIPFVEGATAKYGILDLTYGIASTTLPSHRPGIAILRGVACADGHDRGPDVLGDAGDFLNDLAAECAGQQLYLKVFLQADGHAKALSRFGRPSDLPPGFWPAPFIVADACLTNARSIWLMKHFYL